MFFRFPASLAARGSVAFVVAGGFSFGSARADDDDDVQPSGEILSYGAMRARWPADGAGMNGIPSRSWPPFQPEAAEGPKLLETLLAKCEEADDCDEARFNFATALLASAKSCPQLGYCAEELYRFGAEAGHADSMCALAQCHHDDDEELALKWYSEAAGLQHPQAMYELATIFFLGDREAEALRLYTEAAGLGHAGAMYMLGDCLLEGTACLSDKEAALRWLVAAGDAGHRGARSRVFALIDPTENHDARFTDASRQSLTRPEQPPKKKIFPSAIRRRSTTFAASS